MRRWSFHAALAVAVALAPAAGVAEETVVAPPATSLVDPAPTPDSAAATPAMIVSEPPAPAAAPTAAALPAPTPTADPALASTADSVAAPVVAHADPAATTTTTAAPAPAVAEADSAPARLPRLGVALGAGFPEFAALTALYRPFRFLRVGAGPTWDYYGWGGHVGLSVVPFNWGITPVLAVEAGRYLRTDYSRAVRSGSQSSNDLKPLLAHVDYSYTAVDIGLEFGSPRGFAVSLRTGLAFVWIDAMGTATKRNNDGSTVSITNPALRATLPSTKLSFQYWF